MITPPTLITIMLMALPQTIQMEEEMEEEEDILLTYLHFQKKESHMSLYSKKRNGGFVLNAEMKKEPGTKWDHLRRIKRQITMKKTTSRSIILSWFGHPNCQQ